MVAFSIFLQFSSKDFEVVGKCVESKTNLHSVLLLQFKILLPEGVDTINHGLDKLNLRVSKTVLVGNVIVCPVWPPDSPRVPRGWRPIPSHLAFKASMESLVHPGRSTWTEARMPVPKLVGQE